MSKQDRSLQDIAASSADLRTPALLAATFAVIVVALLPCVVKFLPVIYFDVDPRGSAGENPLSVFGPTGLAWLQTASVFVASIAMAVSVWAGGRVRWLLTGLALVGMIAAAWHMPHQFNDGLQGGGWIAAASLGLAGLHLAQHDESRRWLIASLVAMLVFLAVDAVWYIYIEYGRTVESFLANQDAFLEARGWQEGSPEHELFLRRLTSPDAVGTFGLANVLGSIVASLTVLAAGVAMAMVRLPRSQRWVAFVPAAIAMLGCVAAWLTHSKGVLLTLPLGAGMLGFALLFPKRIGWSRTLGAAALVVIALAVVAVVARGLMGPPQTWEGERSLLFRYQYWQAAVRIFFDGGWRQLALGVGPTEFHQAYLWAKNPLNPEEVVSTHNVFVDYIAMLGLGGAAWVGFLLTALWRGAAAIPSLRNEAEQAVSGEPQTLTRETFALAAIPAAVLFGTQYVIELPELIIESALLWLLVTAAFIATSAVLATKLSVRNLWIAQAGLFAAAVVVLVHNQIEMAFYQVTSVGVLWLIVGVAGAASGREATAATDQPDQAGMNALYRGLPAGVLFLGALVMASQYAQPVAQQQRYMRDAAQAVRQGQIPSAIQLLQRASQADAAPDPRTYRWRVQLSLEAAQALTQFQRPREAKFHLDQALVALDEASAAGVNTVAMLRLRAGTHQLAADLFNEPRRRQTAAAIMEQVIEQSPYNLQDLLRLADLKWDLNDRQRAVQLYRRSLEVNEQSYLDPAKQLSSEQLEHVNKRLSLGEAASP